MLNWKCSSGNVIVYVTICTMSKIYVVCFLCMLNSEKQHTFTAQPKPDFFSSEEYNGERGKIFHKEQHVGGKWPSSFSPGKRSECPSPAFLRTCSCQWDRLEKKMKKFQKLTKV